MKKILFVCTGNTCRSPMAEAILKTKLKNAGIKGYKVTSAGLSAKDGAPMSTYSREALRRFGIKNYRFKSKRLTPDDLLESFLIICMSWAHKSALKGYKNVYTLAELTGKEDISDPYGFGLNEYIDTALLLDGAINVLLNKYLLEE